jgi:hypothetical protein
MDFLGWITSNRLQRAVSSGIMVWVCYSLGVDLDSYLPWIIVLLAWTMEWLAWNEGVIRGAAGWDRMPESTREKLRKMYDFIQQSREKE